MRRGRKGGRGGGGGEGEDEEEKGERRRRRKRRRRRRKREERGRRRKRKLNIKYTAYFVEKITAGAEKVYWHSFRELGYCSPRQSQVE